MPTFVHHSHQISLRAYCIHINKRNAYLIQGIVKPTWRLSFFGFQIQMFHGFHGFQTLPKIRAQTIKTINGFVNQLLASFKWFEGLFATSIYATIPRLVAFQAHLFLTPCINRIYDRCNFLCNRSMKIGTIFRSVVKTPHGCKHIVAVVVKACIFGNLLTQSNQCVIQLIQGISVLQPTLVHCSKHQFSFGSIGAL